MINLRSPDCPRSRGNHVAAIILAFVTSAAVCGAPVQGALADVQTATARHAPTSRGISNGGTATVTGVVALNKSPLAAVEVSLVADAPTGTHVTKTQADASGRFTFAGLAPGSDIGYTVTTSYRGVTFASDSLTLTAGGTHSVALNVYPSTVSPAGVTLTNWTVWLDFTNGRMAVQQDLTVENKGSAAYAGSTPIQTPIGAATGAILLPLAAGAGKFEYLGRFQSCCWATAPGAWAHSRAIAPGSSGGTVRYEAPIAANLSFPAQFPVTSFVILAPVGTRISSPQLQAAGSESDRGTTYQVYRGGPLSLGQVLTIAVAAPAPDLGPKLWAAAGAGIPVLALVAWLILRRRRRNRDNPPLIVAPAGAGAKAARSKPAKAKSAQPKSAQPKSAQPKSAQPKQALTSISQSDPSELADELARLDLAFESGALADEPTYERIREALLARLVAAVAADPAGLKP